MENPRTPDYIKENEGRKKAVDKENEFLKREVMNQGAEDEEAMPDSENIKTDTEKAIDLESTENKDEAERKNEID